MNVKIFLTLRYLRGRKKFLFSSLNLLSLIGITIGVFSLLVVSSVMNGFSEDMMKRVVETKGEVRLVQKGYKPIESYQELLKTLNSEKNIIASAPICTTELLLRNSNYTAYSEVFGIDLNQHIKVSDFYKTMRLGMADNQKLQDNGIILGSELSIELVATVGDTIEVISPTGSVMTPFGYIPRMEKMRVIGIFSSGMPEYDRYYSYISLPVAMYLKNQNGVDYLEVKTKNRHKSNHVTSYLNKKFNPQFIAEDWREIDSSLFNAIMVEKTAMFFVLALMLLLSGFNITGNSVKTITEKKISIALFKTMGLSEKDIFKIVANMGLIIGLIGTLLGELLAFILIGSQLLWKYIQIPVPGFPFEVLPIMLKPWDFLFFGLFSLLICFLSTLIPARKALKYDIIKILRENE